MAGEVVPSAGGWTPKQIEYMVMLASPEDRTEEDMAKELNVVRKTLYTWRQLPGFWNDVYKYVEIYGLSKSATIWKSLIKKCQSGDVDALKLYFSVIGKLKPEGSGGATFMQQQNFYQIDVVEENPNANKITVTQEPTKNISGPTQV